MHKDARMRRCRPTPEVFTGVQGASRTRTATVGGGYGAHTPARRRTRAREGSGGAGLSSAGTAASACGHGYRAPLSRLRRAPPGLQPGGSWTTVRSRWSVPPGSLRPPITTASAPRRTLCPGDPARPVAAAAAQATTLVTSAVLALPQPTGDAETAPMHPTAPAQRPGRLRLRDGQPSGRREPLTPRQLPAGHATTADRAPHRTAITADPCPNSPWFALIPTRAPAT